jgi:hypothetical protein
MAMKEVCDVYGTGDVARCRVTVTSGKTGMALGPGNALIPCKQNELFAWNGALCERAVKRLLKHIGIALSKPTARKGKEVSVVQ